jgi:hypothetical protein
MWNSVPKRIANDEERYLDIRRIGEYLVARRLDHFAVREDDGPAIKRFLLASEPSVRKPPVYIKSRHVEPESPYQLLLSHHENRRVRFEVDSLGTPDDFESFDCYVLFVG